MNEKERKKAAKKFAEFWKGRGYEKGESQQYWISLLRDVLGVEHPETFIRFEDQVKLDSSNGFIDGYIDETKVMIEQKSITKDLNKGIKLSDGTILTPFQQAKKYIVELPVSKHPRWVITCNFKEMYVYDMEKPHGDPEVIKLEDLPKEVYRLSFITDSGSEHLKKEMEVSLKAGEIVGELYDAFSKQYKDISKEESLKSLNKLCVRIVFCLYAEDAGLFKFKNQFHDYLAQFESRHIRQALIDLFMVLNTKEEDRDPYLDEVLLDFPYVNGGLFADEHIEIPRITDEIRELLLAKASDDFDWSEISPTIFGAVFESTLNPETRRSGGMHYTSIENIHKVIDPLFLDDLKAELIEIKKLKQYNAIEKRVNSFQKKLASLKFLDPACGSGNFLTETYLSIRKLENEALDFMRKGQADLFMSDDAQSPIKVSINQFYGIEINDFAVTVAKTALWIAESQMMKETEAIMSIDLDFLPLKTNANIVEGNALRMDWNNVLISKECSYMMGNPPFIGFTYMNNQQKEDMKKIFPNVKNLDYVCGWFKKAEEYINETDIHVGFVCTDTLIQGETVERLWSNLDVTINYAYKSFKWDSEASAKAHVYCTIIGFSKKIDNVKRIFEGKNSKIVDNINYYLIDAPQVIIKSRNKPLCDVPKMIYGNKFADGGNLIIEADDYELFVKSDPQSKKFIRPLLGGNEFLKNKKRYCLWLKDVSPAELIKHPMIMDRIEKCKLSREASKAEGIRKFALKPTLFAQITQPVGEPFILIPRVSGQRKYIPMGFNDGNTIVTDGAQIIPYGTLYEFGVLTSIVHMAWMRPICNKLSTSYRYSKDVVYNNFPWCNPTKQQKDKIEKTAQAILDARAKYPDSSLADMYGEHMYLYRELFKAHQENDEAVMEAYGFTKVVDGKKTWLNESEIVAELFKMYQKLTETK